jgi:hypothetical protein
LGPTEMNGEPLVGLRDATTIIVDTKEDVSDQGDKFC